MTTEPRKKSLHSVDSRRVCALNDKSVGAGPVVYWMSRDQRVQDNWAMLHARDLAEQSGAPLVVAFCLAPHFLGATQRQYGFMLRGLEEVEEKLCTLNIAFHLLTGDPAEEIVRFAKEVNAGAVVTDFDPLRIKQQWHTKAARALLCALHEVDAHNIVPCRVASPKQEFGAYTLRPKLRKVLREYLTDFPKLTKQKHDLKNHKGVDWRAVRASLQVDTEVGEVAWCVPGEKAARRALRTFVDERLHAYDEERNDPTKNAQSNLSPYLHFGHLSAQRVALEVEAHGARDKNAQAYLEELIVRRELSDNFCFYNPHYDTPEGFPAWARKTLSEHAKDPREYTYTRAALEKGRTHDPLWNAAQREMIRTGKMHGYMRMYWAKKILEWTKSVEEAQRIAIYLNDKYEIDGRDPNGYTGIAWSLGGVHDRAWFDRVIFGKIRYMSYNGCKSKFDIEAYIRMHMEK